MLTCVPGTGGTGTPFRLIALAVVNRVGSLASCVTELCGKKQRWKRKKKQWHR